MATPTQAPSRYTVVYRRSLTSTRRYYHTVTAMTPDEARAKTALFDPEYLSSIDVRNYGDIEGGTFEQPTCFVCHKPITDDLYTRVDFGPTTGIQLVCDVDMERAS